MTRIPLSISHPHLTSEADGWDISTVSRGSSMKKPWLCPDYGHSYETEPYNRVAGKGCHYCSNNKLLVGFNDLATTHPHLAAQADGWDPTTVVSGKGVKFAWRCELNHPYEQYILTRKQGSNCPYCARQAILVGFNDLATTNPELAKEAYGWDPTTVMEKSGISREWICPLKHIFDAKPSQRGANRNCPFCSGHRVWPGFNDLATTHPQLAIEAVGWDPTTVSKGCAKKLLWRCIAGLGHENYLSRVAMRTSQEAGCQTCAKHGGDPNLPGWLYILVSYLGSSMVLKFGITSSLESRMRAHRATGFKDEPCILIPYDKTRKARVLELQLRHLMREHSIPTSWDRGYTFTGGTEAFLAQDATPAFLTEFSSLTGFSGFPG